MDMTEDYLQIMIESLEKKIDVLDQVLALDKRQIAIALEQPFDMEKYEKLSNLNTAIDSIRSRYGEDSVKRACFLNSETDHMSGGLQKAKRNSENKV